MNLKNCLKNLPNFLKIIGVFIVSIIHNQCMTNENSYVCQFDEYGTQEKGIEESKNNKILYVDTTNSLKLMMYSYKFNFILERPIPYLVIVDSKKQKYYHLTIGNNYALSNDSIYLLKSGYHNFQEGFEGWYVKDSVGNFRDFEKKKLMFDGGYLLSKVKENHFTVFPKAYNLNNPKIDTLTTTITERGVYKYDEKLDTLVKVSNLLEDIFILKNGTYYVSKPGTSVECVICFKNLKEMIH